MSASAQKWSHRYSHLGRETQRGKKLTKFQLVSQGKRLKHHLQDLSCSAVPAVTQYIEGIKIRTFNGNNVLELRHSNRYPYRKLPYRNSTLVNVN